MLTLFSIGMLTFAFNVRQVKAGTITVPDDYSSIQEAINNANDGDTIYVKNGTYYENVVVNKTVSLIGENRESTIIEGNTTGAAVTITANNTSLSEFTIQTVYHYYRAVSLYNVSHITIANNTIISWFSGMSMYFSHFNTIVGNNITTGVAFSESSNNILRDNIVNRMRISKSSDNTLIGNTIDSLDIGWSPCNKLRRNNFSYFNVDGSTYLHFVQDIDSSNTLLGKPIYYWVDQENGEIPSDAGYVALINSTNITVRNLNLENKRQGIVLAFSRNSQILNNNLINNRYGVWVFWSSNNNISGNNITDNTYGIRLGSSSNNTFYHNNFIDNYNSQLSLYESFDNEWDGGYPVGGNYWNDYAGVDYNGDGIGDEAYVINTLNIDRYPLMKPWTLPPEHELAVFLDAPISILPGTPSRLYGGVINRGLNDETNVVFSLLIDNLVVESETIPLLKTNSYYTISYDWTPTIEDTYEVTVSTNVLPGEEDSSNNQFTRFVRVKSAIQVPDDYPTIQEAINAAEEEDTIHVKAGVYHENVVIRVPGLKLVGEDQRTTIIDGDGETVIIVSASKVSIINLTIRYGDYGIWLNKSSNCLISGNKIMANNDDSIYVQRSSNNVIDANIVENNDGRGILLEGSSNNIISANNVSGNHYWYDAYGIDLTYSSFWGFGTLYSDNNTIIGNNVSNNTDGIRLTLSFYNTMISNTVTNNKYHGIHMETCSENILRDNDIAGNKYNFGVFTFRDEVRLSTYTQDIDTSNTVNGKPIYYFINQKDLTIDSSDIGYLGFVNCTNITIKNLSLRDNGQGLLLAFTTNSTIENVTVTHNRVGLHILGSDATTITENNVTDNGVGMNLYRSSGNSITNNILTNDGISIGNLVFGQGVFYTSKYRPSEDNIVRNNTISNGGIYLSGSGTIRTQVTDNNITRGSGIKFAYYSNTNLLADNTITNGTYGIVLEGSSNNTLRNNNMVNNRYNFWVAGASVSDFVNDIDVSNTVDDKPIYYWVNKQNAAVPVDAGFVALVNCTNIIVKGLHIKNNAEGIVLVNTTNSQITNNNITDNRDGIDLLYSSNNIIYGNDISNNYLGIWTAFSSNNTIVGNNILDSGYCGVALMYSSSNNTLVCNTITDTEFGVAIVDSSNNTLCGNNIARNLCGIDIVHSSNNTIYHNNFINNTYNGYSEYGGYPNVWDDGVEGNYWSDYNGTDTDNDGIGDTPYTIDADNQDNRPLINPYVLLGDLNDDGKVNIKDIAIWGLAFGSYPGHPRWNPNADIDNNGIVNIKDGAKIAKNFGKTL